MRHLNVYEAAERRLKIIFDHFDYVYVSFSGGKDSGVLLNLCIDYLRRYAPGRRLGVFHMDYEAQYRYTTEYVERVFASNRDLLDVYHCCVPFKVMTCTSMHQSYWRPWDEAQRDIWVRERPADALTAADFPFFSNDLWDYDFQYLFAPWLRAKIGCRRICALVGIRTQESFDRWRAVYSDRNFNHLNGLKWTHCIDRQVCTAYPIYDWKTTDVWTAYGRFCWDYNELYDLFHQAGVPMSRQRVASPFISQAIPSLQVYRAVDPDTWGRMVNRVNGVNFAATYGNTSVMGRRTIACPPGFTWREYMYFLLNTLPADIRRNYLEKLEVSIRFWRERGGCLADETIEKLRQAGIPFTIGPPSAYHTTKRPVRMEYIEDFDIPEFRELPTYKRVCICILKNDHLCKYMGFSQTKQEKERADRVMEKYKILKQWTISKAPSTTSSPSR